MEEIKLGADKIGKIFLGDKQIGGGITNQFLDDMGNPIVIINRSNAVKRLFFNGSINNEYPVNLVIEPGQVILIMSNGDDNLDAVDAVKCNVYCGSILDDEVTQEAILHINREYRQGDSIVSVTSYNNVDFCTVIIKE